MGPVAGERSGWATGWAGASRQRPPWAAEQSGRPQREVQPEQASKGSMRTPTRHGDGEGRIHGEGVDMHPWSPPGYWERQVGREERAIRGDPPAARLDLDGVFQDVGGSGSRKGA